MEQPDNYRSNKSSIDYVRQDNIIGFDEEFVELEDRDLCYIDTQTACTLELLENNVDSSNRRHSLMGYFDIYTSTTTGNRLLRQSIMRPICHQKTLEHRLDCIDYLVERVDTLHNISNNIKRFGQNIDLDNIISSLITLYKSRSDTLSMAEKKLDAITNIEVLLSQIPALISSLDGTGNQLFDVYKITLEDPSYQLIINDIYEVIEASVTTNRTKRGKMFRLKHGVEPLFDIARSTYTAAVNDLEQYVRDLNREDSLQWKLMYGESRGYYLQMNSNRINDIKLSPKYMRVLKSRNSITCVTKDMMQSNVRANISYENSMKLANELLTNVLSTIINHLGSLNKLVDVIGMLDLVTSFAKLACNSNGTLIRPRFTSNFTTLEDSRHPVLESVLSIDNLRVVPNNVILKNGKQNFMLVTGPNMGGKSIFLKQVGLIQIMAQMGSYVPASSANIKLVDKIVARSGTTDDTYSNCSSFMWEMKSMATALKRDDESTYPNVLYLIDEVGRGTSIEDGTSYSFAIAEELANRSYAFTVFATHFEQLLYLPQLYKNVVPYHFKWEQVRDSEDGKPKLLISHSIVPGIGEKYHYGLKIAETCDFPLEIISLAMKDTELWL